MPKRTKQLNDAVPSSADELQKKIDALMGPDPNLAPPTRKGQKKATKEADPTPAPEPSTAPEIDDTPAEQKEALDIGEMAVKSETEAAESDDDAVADPVTDEAVDDIAAKESDELLKSQDEKIAEVSAPKDAKKHYLRRFFAAWWHNKYARNTTLLLLFIGLVVTGGIPKSRYFVLNNVGIRSKASIRVLDGSTFRPLKNVSVRLSNGEGLTDIDGNVEFHHLKLGSTQITIEKRGFASVTEPITVGWGSNPYGDKSLTATGTQFTIIVSDFLSKTPLENIEAVSGEASALSDKDGKIVLTLGKEDFAEEAKIQASGYREETIKLPEDEKQEITIALVPSRIHAFISKRSGKYDVYKMAIDGKDEAVVLPGTGTEREDISLVQHPSHDLTALVSTRSGKRNANGYLLGDLTIINLANESTVTVTQIEKIRIIGWVDDRLIYVQTAVGESAGNPNREKLMAYHYLDKTNKELSTANYFNDVLLINGSIYYAPSNLYLLPTDVGFYKINPDGSNKQQITDKQVWNFYRTEYYKLNLAVEDNWYDYEVGKNSTTKASGPPIVQQTKLFADSPDKTHSLWVDTRDGKGVLISYDVASKSEKVLLTLAGLKNPVYWVNNTTIVYRINTNSETADYVVSTLGGDPKKLVDVTDSTGIESWFLY